MAFKAGSITSQTLRQSSTTRSDADRRRNKSNDTPPARSANLAGIQSVTGNPTDDTGSLKTSVPNPVRASLSESPQQDKNFHGDQDD
jgi:hypothetical protein